MKFKLWLLRFLVGIVVAAAAPLLISAALSLLTSLPNQTIGELLRFPAYAVIAASALILMVLFGLIVEPLAGRLEEDQREEGSVKWFNVSKGFGFVTRDSGDDIFVHFRAIRGRGHRSLQEGQRVRFGVVEGSKGLQAEDVTILR